MNDQAPIHYIRLRTFCYSTEKKERVKKAINFFLSKEQEIIEEKIEGNFGNKYWIFKSEIEKSQRIRNLVNKLKTKLTEKQYKELKEKVPDRLDEECNLYLRFDKQKAFSEQLKLIKHGDAVLLRFKVAAYPAKKKNAIEIIRDFL